MHEQSSTNETVSLGSSESAKRDSEQPVAAGPDASRLMRPVVTRKTLRVGAFALGCSTLAALFCGHVMAEQNAALYRISIDAASPAAAADDLFAASAGKRIVDADDLAAPAASPSDLLPYQLQNRTDVGGNSNALTSAVRKPSESPTVTVALERRKCLLPYRRVYRMSRTAGLGQTLIARTGQMGVLEKTYKVTYRADKPVAFQYEGRRVVKSPVDMLIDAGYTDRAARALPSRSGLYTRDREIDMMATGYSPMEGSGSGRCANGMRAGYGVVAVDPRLIPLGSKLFIEGYGYALAGDTGGAIHGARIDLGQNTYYAASMVGRRRVRVYVLNDTTMPFSR